MTVRDEIEALVYRYAELIDEGDFAGVGDLFAAAQFRAFVDGAPTDPPAGADAARQLLESTTRRYDDGTPRTKHVITNLVVQVDESGEQASARSYYTVFQQVDTHPLQPIMSGRYEDRFALVDGAWRFADRLNRPDLIGDISRVMLISAP
jgi:3-phenylpropionate/cinnamic acid dioxygenase small subunit